jgi:hypothetical protein
MKMPPVLWKNDKWVGPGPQPSTPPPSYWTPAKKPHIVKREPASDDDQSVQSSKPRRTAPKKPPVVKREPRSDDDQSVRSSKPRMSRAVSRAVSRASSRFSVQKDLEEILKSASRSARKL